MVLGSSRAEEEPIIDVILIRLDFVRTSLKMNRKESKIKSD